MSFLYFDASVLIHAADPASNASRVLNASPDDKLLSSEVLDFEMTASAERQLRGTTLGDERRAFLTASLEIYREYSRRVRVWMPTTDETIREARKISRQRKVKFRDALHCAHCIRERATLLTGDEKLATQLRGYRGLLVDIVPFEVP